MIKQEDKIIIKSAVSLLRQIGASDKEIQETFNISSDDFTTETAKKEIEELKEFGSELLSNK